MSQSILNYFNNVMQFDGNCVRFEAYSDKLDKKNVICVDFTKYSEVEKIATFFNELTEMKNEMKLHLVIPKVTNYKIRGILSIAEDTLFTDSNISEYVDYLFKSKEVPTLDKFNENLCEYFKSDKLKIRVFNKCFPHGIHERSKDKAELKGVDKVYLQKIGGAFDTALESICKTLKVEDALESVKSAVTEKHSSTLKTKADKSAFLTAANQLSPKFREYIELDKLKELTDEQKADKKKLKQEIDSSRAKDWFYELAQEYQHTNKLFSVIECGMEFEKLDKKAIQATYKTYLDSLAKFKELAETTVASNAEFVEFSKKVMDIGDAVFGEGKGVSVLNEAQANIKQLLNKKDTDAFMKGEQLSDETVEHLFDSTTEFSKIKAIQRLAPKTLPTNVKIALGIYISNEFYTAILREIANKHWQRRTIYVKF